MDKNEELLQYFSDVKEALMSGDPFRLTPWCTGLEDINFEEMTEDQLLLLHNALLYEDRLHWTIHNELDRKFFANLMAVHEGVDFMHLIVCRSIDFDEDTMTAIQSSKVRSVCINKQTAEVDVTLLLQALQHNKYLHHLTAGFALNCSEYDSIACAVANEHLQEFILDIEVTDPATYLSLWQVLQPVISNHKSLKLLDLIGSSPIGHILGEIFSVNKSIQKLSLCGYHDKTESNWTAFGSGLMKNTTLKEIELIESSTVSNLLELTALTQCHVELLSFCNIIFSEDDLQALGKTLENNTKVCTLEFAGIDFTVDSQPWSVLIQNKSLKKLILRSCKVDMKALCDGVRNNSSLKVLELWGCETTDDQCQLIAQMLMKNKSLNELFFESDNGSDASLVHIYEAVASNTTLQKLVLGLPKNGVEGMTGVKSMLVQNSTLQHLKITIDYKSEAAVGILCDGLKNNTHLTHLTFGEYFPVDDALEQMFIAALQDNYALDTIDFGIDDNTLQALQGFKVQEFVQRNRLLKSQIKFKIAILSHNIARSREALTTLPREIWIGVLSMVTHPGLESFESFVRAIFDSYMHK